VLYKTRIQYLVELSDTGPACGQIFWIW